MVDENDSCGSTANVCHNDEDPRDPAENFIETSKCQSDSDAEEPLETTVKPEEMVTKPKLPKPIETRIPMRQVSFQERDVTYRYSNTLGNVSSHKTSKLVKRKTIGDVFALNKKTNDLSSTTENLKTHPIRDFLSHEAVTSSVENTEVGSEKLVLCTTSAIISEPKNNESATLTHDCHEDIQDNHNELMEKFPKVDLSCDSNEGGDESSNYEAEEHYTQNDGTIKTVDEDKSQVPEFSDETLTGEPNDDSYLEADSIVLLERNPIVPNLSEVGSKDSELKTPYLNDTVSVFGSSQERTETMKSLRDRFEAVQNDRSAERSTPKANTCSKRFDNQVVIKCESCEKRVYFLEKVEIESRVYHKSCFKCSHCQCILRMDSFTRNRNRLYCMPHFKQLFKTNGNFEQGFGGGTGRN